MIYYDLLSSVTKTLKWCQGRYTHLDRRVSLKPTTQKARTKACVAKSCSPQLKDWFVTVRSGRILYNDTSLLVDKFSTEISLRRWVGLPILVDHDSENEFSDHDWPPIYPIIVYLSYQFLQFVYHYVSYLKTVMNICQIHKKHHPFRQVRFAGLTCNGFKAFRQ